MPREENKEDDRLSKQVDYDDWFITKDLVQMLTNKWDKVTIDRSASHTNKKTQRFNSKCICPGSEDVNAFSVDWSNENNLLVPPSIFNSKDDQAFYVIKIFSIQHRQYWCVHTGLLQHFGHCYSKRRENFKVSLTTGLLLRMFQST